MFISEIALKIGIYQYVLKNGKLIKNSVTNDFERCTYLTQKKLYLYSVIEIEEGNIISYKKERDKLKFIDKKLSCGKGPCHIEIDEKHALIFVSNYTNGYFTVFKMNKNGTIGKKIFCNVENKDKSHVHCAKLTIDNKFIFMTDLGENLIIAYEIKEDKLEEVARIKLEEDTQPRHIAVDRENIYVVTEKSCELYILKFENKKFSIKDKVNILPNNIKKRNDFTGCAIKISKNLKYIYVTIRGHNSISIYKIKKKKIKMIQNISCEGKVPRDLEIDKKEKYLLVANQDSNDIAIFKRNKINGKIKYKNKENMYSPTCVIIE